jgi:hypothetical protein
MRFWWGVSSGEPCSRFFALGCPGGLEIDHGFVLGRLLEFGIEALALEVPPTLLALADEDIE